MIVTMMQVRVMDVLVPHGLVSMPMRVRFGHTVIVRVPVVLVVHVAVLMLEPVVDMFVLVPLCEVEPEAKPHKQAGDDELRADRLAQQ